MRIHAIQTGTVVVKSRQRRGTGRGPLRAINTMADRAWTDPLPVLAWVIEHPEGLIVVDTGETAHATEPGYFPRWHPYFRLAVRLQVTRDEELGPQLERRGLSPGDVHRVVLTHLHTDHAGGLHHVAHADVLASRTELALATGRGAQLRGYLPHRWPAGLTIRPVDFGDGAFGPFEASHRLTRAGDVVLLPTPGHTAGHLAVAVRRDEGLVVLAGDASYTQAILVEGVADGVTDDPATHVRTLATLRALAAAEPTIYLPAHDPHSAARLASGETVPA